MPQGSPQGLVSDAMEPVSWDPLYRPHIFPFLEKTAVCSLDAALVQVNQDQEGAFEEFRGDMLKLSPISGTWVTLFRRHANPGLRPLGEATKCSLVPGAVHRESPHRLHSPVAQ